MEQKSRVVVVPCDSYDEEIVYQCMQAGIAALGGIGSFVRPEEKILVKPNFLVASEPEKAVITHPAVINSMLRILQEAGCVKVACGDSPGHGSNEHAAKLIGLDESARQYGAALADMSTEVSVDFPEGMTANQFWFTMAAAEAEVIIGLSKMKTHMLERITGAVKNMYGLICGYRKAAGHVKYPNASVFARMLADIHRATPQRLHIMDGIVAMEGNGPGSGTPVHMNVLLFSADPVALDTVFCMLIKLDPDTVPTNVQGEAMGIGTCHSDRIEIVEVLPEDGSCPAEHQDTKGEPSCRTADFTKNSPDIEKSVENGMRGGSRSRQGRVLTPEELFGKYGNADFDVDRKGVKKNFLSRFSAAMTAVARRPYIQKVLCVKCGVCVEHCPVPGKAVDFRNGKTAPPVYDYGKCIRCYCCQEMCPQHAIRVRGRFF